MADTGYERTYFFERCVCCVGSFDGPTVVPSDEKTREHFDGSRRHGREGQAEKQLSAKDF